MSPSVTASEVFDQGTPRLKSTSAGAQAGIYIYYPFGEETHPVLDGQLFRFTGHERDQLGTSGTADDRDYMHQRSFLPSLGRFLSPDPIGGSSGNPQSWNRYSYTLNNPLKYVDPFGLDIDSCVGTNCTETINVVGNLGPAAPFAPGGSGYGAWLWGQFNGGPSAGAGQAGSGGGAAASGSASGVGINVVTCTAPAGVDADLNADLMRASLVTNTLVLGPAFGVPLTWGVATALVAPSSAWDFKHWRGASFEPFGNYHFGRVFSAAMVPQEIALRGAGLAQRLRGTSRPEWGVPWGSAPFGDDPRDQERIRQGYAGEECR